MAIPSHFQDLSELMQEASYGICFALTNVAKHGFDADGQIKIAKKLDLISISFFPAEELVGKTSDQQPYFSNEVVLFLPSGIVPDNLDSYAHTTPPKNSHDDGSLNFKIRNEAIRVLATSGMNFPDVPAVMRYFEPLIFHDYYTDIDVGEIKTQYA